MARPQLKAGYVMSNVLEINGKVCYNRVMVAFAHCPHWVRHQIT